MNNEIFEWFLAILNTWLYVLTSVALIITMFSKLLPISYKIDTERKLERK